MCCQKSGKNYINTYSACNLLWDSHSLSNSWVKILADKKGVKFRLDQISLFDNSLFSR